MPDWFPPPLQAPARSLYFSASGSGRQLGAWAALRISDAGWSGAVGLVAGVCAAPALLAVGAPFGDNDLYPIAVGASAVMWLLVGWLATRRATRNPMATWRDYWRHFAWLCGGIWLGACAALGVSALVVADPLL